MMLRFRVSILLVLGFFITIIFAQDVMQTAQDKISNSNKLVLQKSQAYSDSNWIKNAQEDLTASAAEYVGAKYLPPSRSHARSCYECNKEPWIPIVGRSMNFPHFKEKPHFSNKHFNLHHPPIDQYGAPQGQFDFPSAGQVVDFMLPPPFQSGSILTGPGFYPGPPKPVYSPPKQYSQKPPSFGLNNIISPPPLPNYAPTHSYNKYQTSHNNYNNHANYAQNYNKFTTHLRPVSQDFQPPLPGGGIHNLPLENHLPPPIPSDSYGRPLHNNYAEPITLASEENLIQGLTDVQVVPSLRIADYTASIEHPINLIQSPILDLDIKDHMAINRHVQGSVEDSRELLSENPIVVEDTHTSATNINTTTTYYDDDRRLNDKYLSSEADLTDNLIKKLILEQNIIEDPKSQIVGIKKGFVNPENEKMNLNIVQPSVTNYYSTLPTVMIPPPHPSTWLRPVNESYIKAKNKLQIIVPYQKAPAIYNKNYSTLAPVFVPPAISTESNVWTQLMEDITTVEAHKEPSKPFAQSSTEVYNIKDFLVKNGYDLQKNIDDWTHQAYSNKFKYTTTKLAHVKHIPGEYFSTTPSPILDHVASSSENRDFIANNLITKESSTKPSVRFIVRKPSTPSWEKNKVLLSNSTHEKVYVVTPQTYHLHATSTPATAFSMAPRIQNGQVNTANTMTKISVRIEAPNEKSVRELKPVKVVYSEWPHLINDLATTTTQRPTSRHPLFGLMDLAPYTLGTSAVETISGHSKVSTVSISSTTPIIPSSKEPKD